MYVYEHANNLLAPHGQKGSTHLLQSIFHNMDEYKQQKNHHSSKVAGTTTRIEHDLPSSDHLLSGWESVYPNPEKKDYT